MEKIVQAQPLAGAPRQPLGVVKNIPLKSVNKEKLVLAIIAVVVVLAGIGTGIKLSGGLSSASKVGNVAPGAKDTKTEAGIQDEKAFPDSAEGVLEEGGISGEGTHHLVRPGGASQNVYLTSTVIDLQSFAGKKVKVWGQTISARKAGWLMDVGKVKVIE